MSRPLSEHLAVYRTEMCRQVQSHMSGKTMYLLATIVLIILAS